MSNEDIMSMSMSDNIPQINKAMREKKVVTFSCRATTEYADSKINTNDTHMTSQTVNEIPPIIQDIIDIMIQPAKKAKRVKTNVRLPHGARTGGANSITNILLPTRPQQTMLIPLSNFKEHINEFFGDELKKCKINKISALHVMWHEFNEEGVASFGFNGKSSVWGFHTVTVVNRDRWNIRILEIAKLLVRNHSPDKPAKRPIQTIYEIMQYCGMRVVGRGNVKNIKDMKALLQDEYCYDPVDFEYTKKRAINGW